MFGSFYFGQPYFGQGNSSNPSRTIDIPQVSIAHQSLTNNSLFGYPDAKVDDTIYLVDDPSILTGSQATIYEGIRPYMPRIKKSSL